MQWGKQNIKNKHTYTRTEATHTHVRISVKFIKYFIMCTRFEVFLLENFKEGG